ncbi:bifunctional glutamate--cysteine ligase/glutathione synthetase [Haemophilus paracuniculus]|uniref:Glutathione biosynthesis bifunctional protein GshAB n=1 Tax=Haemophilus paracuniculus TaxID=734 RepID=A0A1T0AQI9_9PAST|nr:bifunctional glutamate--cysteine ligase GshA/glutathione synthetase GshB [Haemophilus paracuniculus]OOR98341.1 bifunctional glutamate--cysteine ligase/glutathione synthetase [Haemophilus paracuniculus]
MKLQQIIRQHQLGLLFQQGMFGLEKESQRIDLNGKIVKTPHPKCFGSRRYHPYIQTDFAESQLELITPPNAKLEDSYRWLSAIHEVVWRSLPDDESLFSLSMPAGLPDESEIQEARLGPTEIAYREHLSRTYGKMKQMVSGIHYNFQLSPDFIKAVLPLQSEHASLRELQNAIYMKLATNFLRYQWILVYLLAASPTVEPAYFGGNAPLATGQFVRSLRSSRYGYVNDPKVKVNHDSLADYVQSLEQLVADGLLIAEKEYYSNVRLRGAKKVRTLLEQGVQYAEFRLFDLNPFSPYGITLDDAKFVHLFLLLMLWLDETAGQAEVDLGRERLYQVALENPLEPTAYQAEGEQILRELLAMCEALQIGEAERALVEQKLAQFSRPNLTIAGRLVEILKETDYQTFGTQLAQRYKAQAFERFYALSAFDNMELSTQALLFDLIQQGISVELLDENDQFLALKLGDHLEYVKNGNMTSHDQYISPLIMENKVVTKKVLAKAGFNVPKSVEFTDLDTAVAHYPLFEGKAIVIKPKSTNFGLGITIFQQGVTNRDDFRQAVEIAFREDKEVMVEDYLVGTEYRFFVLGDQTLAVLLRVPANVVGDGVKTVRELVEQKNSDPLRGDGSRSPLKKIALGEIELLQLKEQGFTPDSVPAAGQTVQLRANSNISTGGDSIDMTDQMHDNYKQLAVGIAHAMGAKVCGVDMIIPDLTQPARADLSSWGVIEANFNPMMMMHIFPYQGKSRRLTKNVIEMLFPELADLNKG